MSILAGLPFFAPKAPAAPGAIEYNEHHRDVRGGAIRAAIFGISDGLVTNVSLILGVAGADADAGVVRLAGLAGLAAGAFSMAAGEYVSMSAQKELLERELEVERRSIRADPQTEIAELAAIYRSRGIDAETAQRLASQLMKQPDLALEVHAREELGVNPRSLGSPIAASVSSFVAFGIGAFIPLLPWFFTAHTAAVALSIALGAVTALLIGAAIGVSTGRPPLFTAMRQLVVGALAGGVTYGLGAVLGVQVS
jgi:VIT1/CCC1 family predicted Fe2+/Mn2+ transporter